MDEEMVGDIKNVQNYLEQLHSTLYPEEPCKIVLNNMFKILQNNEKARKSFCTKEVGGIRVLISFLETCKDMSYSICVLHILKLLLSFKTERSFVVKEMMESNTVSNLVKILHFVTPANINRDTLNCVSCIYTILNRVASRDKKFSVKMRLIGYLKVFHQHVQAFGAKPKILNPILILLHRILNNASNSKIMGRDGLIRTLLCLLSQHQHNISNTLLYIMECLATATHQKTNVTIVLQCGSLGSILNLLETPNHTWNPKHRLDAKILSSTLETLVHLAYTKVGRQYLTNSNVVDRLLSWCQTPSLMPAGVSAWERLAALVSIVVQRLLPPIVLPVPSLAHFMAFNINARSPEKNVPAEIPEKAKERKCSLDEEESVTSSTITSEDDDCAFEDMEDDSTASINVDDDDIDQFPSTDVNGKELQKYFRFFPEFTKEEHKREISLNAISQATFPLKNTLSNCNFGSPQTVGKGSKWSVDMVPFLPHHYHRLLDYHPEDPAEETPIVPLPKVSNNEFQDLFQKLSQNTKAVVPLAKLAYPDLWGYAHVNSNMEPFHEPLLDEFRCKLLSHIERKNTSGMYRKVYDVKEIAQNDDDASSSLHADDHQKLDLPLDGQLYFESRFESGNLRLAFQKGETEYDLVLNPDLNTTSHHQWFYFQVWGMQGPSTTYTFNIINCEKSRSLYLYGMSPVLFSVKASRSSPGNDGGWKRLGHSVYYFRNQFVKDSSITSLVKDKPFYTLSFNANFPYAGDVCYLAYHYPYPYSLLQTHIAIWKRLHDNTNTFFEVSHLCETLSGNPLPILTITSKPPNGKRPYIFLTSRVHPGESNSSWVMKGTLDFLLSNSPIAQLLREHFIFKVVPMLNPDGVINGNYRCSLVGVDLNRQWTRPNELLHPSIFHTKNLLVFLASLKKTPLVFCDFHGHSRKKNVFLYGCSPSNSWFPRDYNQDDAHSYEVLPLVLAHLAPAFSMENCCFSVEKNRETTARISVWRSLKLPLSYTMECTYGGCDQGPYNGFQLGLEQLEEMGAKFCEALEKLIPGIAQSDAGTYYLDVNKMPGLGLLFQSERYSRCSSASLSVPSDEEMDG